jgi:6-phosphogluconate dehydrogenase
MAYSKDHKLSNILLDQKISEIVKDKISSLRKTASFAASNGIPSLGIQTALGYFEAYTTESLPVNLLQAQRDYFGAHTYQRIDREGVFHSSWQNLNN